MVEAHLSQKTPQLVKLPRLLLLLSLLFLQVSDLDSVGVSGGGLRKFIVIIHLDLYPLYSNISCSFPAIASLPE